MARLDRPAAPLDAATALVAAVLTAALHTPSKRCHHGGRCGQLLGHAGRHDVIEGVEACAHKRCYLARGHDAGKHDVGPAPRTLARSRRGLAPVANVKRFPKVLPHAVMVQVRPADIHPRHFRRSA